MNDHKKIPCTVYIMTLNSGPNFIRTLESVKQFDEILVCDGNSTDGTQDVARSYGARIISQTDSSELNRPMTDFPAVHNKCRTEAKYDWIFQLDHDEVMPPETAEEIRSIVSRPIEYYIYKVPNRIFYKGRLIKYATVYPGYEMRFFNRTCGAYYVRHPHSRLTFDEKKYPVGYLKNPWYAYDEGMESTRYRYLQMEIKDARKQSLQQFFRWTIFNKIFKIIKLAVKITLLYSRHGTAHTLPFNVEFDRIRYAIALMLGITFDRLKRALGQHND